MKKLSMSLALIAICFAAVNVWADTLEMKDGRLLDGKYVGGTQHSIRFQIDNQVRVFPVQDVLALTFSSYSGSEQSSSDFPTQSSRVSTPTPKPQQQAGRGDELVLEPGTKIPVRMLESLYLNNSHKGDSFRGSLESDVQVNGITVLPQGARVNGQVVASEQGRMGSTLAITISEVVVDDQVIPLKTSNYMVQDKAENVLDLGMSSLRIVKRERDMQIPYRSVVEFETLKPVRFRRAQ